MDFLTEHGIICDPFEPDAEMENLGGSLFQVLDAGDFNLENVQFVNLGENGADNWQHVVMQAPNQAELVVNEAAQGQQTQVIYQTQDQGGQTYVLQQTSQEQQRIPQSQVVFQAAPVTEERISEQPVSLQRVFKARVNAKLFSRVGLLH